MKSEGFDYLRVRVSAAGLSRTKRFLIRNIFRFKIWENCILKDSRFNLFGTKYKMRFMDTVPSDDPDRFTWGDTDGRTHVVRIATKDVKGKDIDDDEVEITKFHELMHVIFSEGQYSSCNSDEPLVEWCARCLHSLKKQGIL